MNKKEFQQYLKKELGDLPLEKREQTLDKICNDWIPSIKNDMLKNYKFCIKCKKYHLKKKYKQKGIKENRIKTTYTDCGYGDDDRFGEVECYVTYEICPECGNKVEVSCWDNRIIWEKTRWGEKKYY